MHSLLFYLFSFLAVTGGILLVAFRNPVSSALSMVLSFLGLAGLFIGLNAFFVGIVQILVYAGAIMVLFIFIIMLLDLNNEEKVKFRSSTIALGLIIPICLAFQILGVIQSQGTKEFAPITKETLSEAAKSYPEDSAIHKSLAHEKSPQLPDTNLIGQQIFTHYNFPLQVIGALLLVATIGVVVLSKRSAKNRPTDS
ncbi:NADH-quinone oxidoreductase subunit J [Akkermansiaceae bacterium]|nr:NADH-quinone oxidoreductase subunit J [Akkermansiaceae bacterium]